MRKTRGLASRAIVYTLVFAFAAGLGLMLGQRHFAGAPLPHKPDPALLKAVRLINPRHELPDYRLNASDGSTLTPATLRGHWTVVFLGFTHCADVCPTTLANMAQAQKQWAAMPETIRPRLLFVSVDPERDTAKIVGAYAHFFHPDTLAATAAEPELGNFAQALGLVYLKVALPDGNYTMDHSTTLIVLDPLGRQAGLIRPPLVAANIASDLRTLAESSP